MIQRLKKNIFFLILLAACFVLLLRLPKITFTIIFTQCLIVLIFIMIIIKPRKNDNKRPRRKAY
jgi:L-asparagine transporter-like permease